MYNAVIPSYDADKGDGGNDGVNKGKERIKADDPANKEMVRKHLFE